MNVKLTSINGETVAVIVAPPDYGAAPFSITYRHETEVVEGLTGIEQRRSDSHSMRLTVRYSATLRGTDAQTWRDAIGQTNGLRVALPLWIDARPRAQWEDRLHDSQLVAGWNAGFLPIAIGAINIPPGDVLAPVVVGRLNTRKAALIDPATATVEIELTEDRPDIATITPARPAPDTFRWRPNWESDLSEDVEDSLRYEQLGRGTEQHQEGDPLIRRIQPHAFTLPRAEAGAFLAFWHARRGEYESFAAPSIWQPGEETPYAPHAFDGGEEGLARFAGPSLRFEWSTPAVADCAATLQQEVTSAKSQAQPSYAFLFRFFRSDDTGLEETVTDWESTISADGKTWKPAKIEAPKLRLTLNPADEKATFDVALEDVTLLQPLARHEVEVPIWVEVLEYDFATATTSSLFLGKIGSSKMKGMVATVNAALFGGALGRKTPRLMQSRTCNYSVFDRSCARRSPDQMSRTNWKAIGIYVETFADGKIALDTCTFPQSFHDYVAAHPTENDGWGIENWHYYNGGWAETGTGKTRQARQLTFSAWDADAGVMHLIPQRPFRGLQPGDVISFWPGCDGSYKTCCAKFGNGGSFGGFPFTPEYLEEIAQSMEVAGK